MISNKKDALSFHKVDIFCVTFAHPIKLIDWANTRQPPATLDGSFMQRRLVSPIASVELGVARSFLAAEERGCRFQTRYGKDPLSCLSMSLHMLTLLTGLCCRSTWVRRPIRRPVNLMSARDRCASLHIPDPTRQGRRPLVLSPIFSHISNRLRIPFGTGK